MGSPARWDTKLGRELYDQGHTYVAIAAVVDTSPNAVSNYAARYWPTRASGAELAAKRALAKTAPQKLQARPIPPGERTLPDLPSLRGYY